MILNLNFEENIFFYIMLIDSINIIMDFNQIMNYNVINEFISHYNEFIVNHYINIEYDQGYVIIKILSADHILIAYNQFYFKNNNLHISHLGVNREYRGQYIGTFLILLSLTIVNKYTELIGLRDTQVTVTLDDMSKSSRKKNNIYISAGLHYEERDSLLPEMTSSLAHTLRISEINFKSKIKLIKEENRQTIFNLNNNYFHYIGGVEKNKNIHKIIKQNNEISKLKLKIKIKKVKEKKLKEKVKEEKLRKKVK